MKKLLLMFLMILLFPIISKAATCTITYVIEQGPPIEINNTQDIECGTIPSFLHTITKEGYTFKGWFKDAEYTIPFTGDEVINSNIKVYGKWVDNSLPTTCTISYLNPNGTVAAPAESISCGETLTSMPSPSRTGCQFRGWFYDTGLTNPFTGDSPINSDLSVYAKWVEGSSSPVLGDWNNDGSVNALDLANYRKYLANNSEVVNSFTTSIKSRADMNSDGKVDLIDLVKARIKAAS